MAAHVRLRQVDIIYWPLLRTPGKVILLKDLLPYRNKQVKLRASPRILLATNGREGGAGQEGEGAGSTGGS